MPISRTNRQDEIWVELNEIQAPWDSAQLEPEDAMPDGLDEDEQDRWNDLQDHYEDLVEEYRDIHEANGGTIG